MLILQEEWCYGADHVIGFRDQKDKVSLNMGCGNECGFHTINCDKNRDSPCVDILLDLDYPLPFKSESIDEVYLYRAIAHVKHPIKLRRELNRVLKDGGRLYIADCACGKRKRKNKRRFVSGKFVRIGAVL